MTPDLGGYSVLRLTLKREATLCTVLIGLCIIAAILLEVSLPAFFKIKSTVPNVNGFFNLVAFPFIFENFFTKPLLLVLL